MEHVLRTLVSPQWGWIPVALVAQLVAFGGYVLAYRGTLRVDDGVRLTVPHATALVFAGFGAFVPRGGFAMDQLALEQLHETPRHARTRVLALGVLEYVVLAPATCIAAVVLLADRAYVSAALTLPWIIGVPAGFVLAAWAARHREKLRGPGRVRAWLRDGLDALVLMRRMLRPFESRGALGGMVLYWLADVFALWATLHAFLGDSPNVPRLVVGYATGYALTRRTLPLAGAGAVEALMPFALHWIGEPLAPSIAAVFFYRVVNLWLPLLPAFVAERELRHRHHAVTGGTAGGQPTATDVAT